MLARRDVVVLPGTAVEMPGYFRISVTATDEMLEVALPRFAAAIEKRRPRSGRRARY
jgi:aspartate aminotransferase